MMNVTRPKVFAVAFGVLVAGLPFANMASAQQEGQSLLSWLRPSLERIELTERPRSTNRSQRPIPREEESGDPAQRPPVVLDERNGRGDRSRRPRGRSRQDERPDRERHPDRRRPEAERGRHGGHRGSATHRSGRAGNPQRSPHGKRQPGPPFCRSGTGHPVFGMEWCRERGFAPQAAPDRRYERNRRSRERARRRKGERRWYEQHRRERNITYDGRRQHQDARLTAARLEDVLGPRTLAGLERLARRFGNDSALTGRWVGDREKRVLRIQAGPQMLAELIDHDRDGQVDRTLLAEPIGRR